MLLGECLGGALYIEDFIRLCRAAGFQDPRALSTTEIEASGGHLLGNGDCRLCRLARCRAGTALAEWLRQGRLPQLTISRLFERCGKRAAMHLFVSLCRCVTPS